MTAAMVDAAPTPDRQKRSAARWLVRVVALGGALVMMGTFLRGDDFARAVQLVRRSGWQLGFVLLPNVVAIAFDAQGWRLILRMLRHEVQWRAVFRIRVAVEAIVLAVPGGPVAGEAVKAGLLRARAGVPVAAGAASLALTKASLWGSEGIYMTIAGLCVAVRWAGGGLPNGLPVALAFGGATVMATLSILTFAALRRATWATRLADALVRLPIQRVRRAIEARRAGFSQVDRQAASYFASPLPVRARSLRAFTLEWLFEGLETYLILRGVGAAVGVPEALAVDSVTSLLRAVAFFVPMGLGVQEVSQVVMLRLLGVPDASAMGAALILIRRTREVCWVFAGSLLLAGREAKS